MFRPEALKFGDTIGIVSPSSPTSEENVKKSEKKLKELGFKVKMGESVSKTYGYLAGSDEDRARDLNHMFLDDEVKGIICIRGGYGTPRILELLDYEGIKNNPKIFIGYSDITALHIAMNQICSLITFHGPMVASNMIDGFDDFSKESLFRNIFNNEPIGLVENPEGEEIETISGGIGEGEIVGGNLSLVVDTLGTPYEIDTKGKLLLLEEVGEEPYNIDRMLTQLRLSGKLEEANGIILGDWNGCEAKSDEYNESLTLIEVFEDIIKPLNIPTIYNLKSGHCKPMITLPLGAKARLDADNKKLYVLESGVK